MRIKIHIKMILALRVPAGIHATLERAKRRNSKATTGMIGAIILAGALNVACHAAAFRLFERRLRGGALGWQISQRFRHQQHADAIGGAAKFLGRGVHVAKLNERVVNQRMRHDVHGHAGKYTTIVG